MSPKPISGYLVLILLEIQRKRGSTAIRNGVPQNTRLGGERRMVNVTNICPELPNISSAEAEFLG
jgi:hypothetical protein